MADEALRPEPTGPEHEVLARRAGRYTHVTTIRMAPEDEPQVFEGEAELRPVLGGRFLLEERTADTGGEPVRFLKLHGYNLATGQYETLWTFNLKTSMVMLTGSEEDGGRTVRFSGSYVDREEGEVALEAATHQVDEDHFVLEVYGRGPTGKRFTVQETAYSRKA